MNSSSHLFQSDIVERFLEIEHSAAVSLTSCGETSSKVKYLLNPLDYATDPHVNFLNKYLAGPKPVLFVGLNPGPWGMCQTGIPFGEVNQCTNFLGITGKSPVH